MNYIDLEILGLYTLYSLADTRMHMQMRTNIVVLTYYQLPLWFVLSQVRKGNKLILILHCTIFEWFTWCLPTILFLSMYILQRYICIWTLVEYKLLIVKFSMHIDICLWTVFYLIRAVQMLWECLASWNWIEGLNDINTLKCWWLNLYI